MSQLDISKLNLQELKALGFDQQRELGNLNRNMEVLFKEIQKREQETPAEKEGG